MGDLNVKVTEEGIQAPEVDQIISGLWDMFVGAFGEDLNTDMSTPQGQLVTSLAAIISDTNNQLVSVLNQFDPLYAHGVWQDAIGYIYFMKRKPATHSTAQLKVIGLSGVVIPEGFRFLDENNELWETTKQNIISENGEVIVNVECVNAGVIEAAPNTINIIVKSLAGLDRATNESAAAVGSKEETQRDFELRRKDSVALNSKNTNSATYGAVYNLDGVLDVYVYDNPSDITITIGSTNYPLIRNSILVSVVGGDPEEIAYTILTKAGSGCSFNGNTEITVKDLENFPNNPPTYKVRFERPENIPIRFKVTLDNKSLMANQDEKAIKETILASFSSGAAKARIGQQIIASRFICPVSNAIPNLAIISLEVSRDGVNYINALNVGVNEFPVTSSSLIEVV